MGIVDDDLKYIFEIKPDKYRIAIRTLNDKKESKIVYGLENAINEKWKMLDKIEREQEKINSLNNKNLNYLNITIEEGFKLFFEERLKKVDKGLIELSTYQYNIKDYNDRFIKDSKILKMKLLILIKKKLKTMLIGYMNKSP